jgi:hypothetical protein
VRGRGEHDALGPAALVEVGQAAVRHQHYHLGRVGDVPQPGCAIESADRTQDPLVPQQDQLPWLPVARATGPAGDLQHVVDDAHGQRMWREAADGTQAA